MEPNEENSSWNNNTLNNLENESLNLSGAEMKKLKISDGFLPGGDTKIDQSSSSKKKDTQDSKSKP